jgi:signal recognition particle subunit SRP54
MFDTLGHKLDDVFRKLKNRGRLTDKDVEVALREIRLALLEADVALPAVKNFLARIKEKAAGEEIVRSLTPGQQVVKIVNDELINMLGGSLSPLKMSPKPPTVILLAGLQGAGKTTLAAKLGLHLKGKGHKVLLVAADLQRPAAIRQLEILAGQAGVQFFGDTSATDPIEVALRGLEMGHRNADVVIVDTAGRLHIDEDMMVEVKLVHDIVSPDEVLFVLDSMTGQDAVTSAKAFSEVLPLTGIVLTKIDGDARGGAALSATTVTGKPIKFASTGEKLTDLEPFHPDRIASRILGMGDVLSLIERAEATMDAELAEKQAMKVLEAKFTLEDFLDQIQSVKKMGGFADLLKMLPGIPGSSKRLSDIEVEDSDVAQIEAIIRSMTPRERQDPRIISGSRRARIARGSGCQVREVNDLLKQFNEARKMMKQMSKFRPGRKGQFTLPPGFG